MSEKKKVPGKPFVKGDPRAGRKPVDRDVQAIRVLNHMAVQRMLNEYMQLPEEELRKIMKQKDLPIIHKAFIQCLIQAGQGKLPHLDLVMDRTVGKVPDVRQDLKFDFTGLPKERVIELGEQAIKQLKGETE